MTNDFKNRNNDRSNSSANKPRLSKEEYKIKKEQERNEVYEMIDQATIDAFSSPEKFVQYLDTQSRLDRYSATNALLIGSQFPEASQLKSYEDWNKENVNIKKGAKSISMLEPVEYTKRDGSNGITYAVKRVFDVSQTTARRQPVPSLNRDPQALFRTMLKSSPVNVEMQTNLSLPDAVAYYDNDEQTIFIKREVGDSVLLTQSLAQELAHAQLSIDSDTYSRRDMGFQAVCIGYMLCKKYGVDTKNFAIDRIPEKYKGMEEKDIRKDLTKMRNAMSSINSRVSDELYKKRQERSKGAER